MSLESIAAATTNMGLAPLSSLPPAEGLQSFGEAPQASHAFESLLASLTQINGQLNAADQGLQSVAAGNLDNLHQSMMGMEQTRLALQLLLQVRSRALDAYQELMRMQV